MTVARELAHAFTSVNKRLDERGQRRTQNNKNSSQNKFTTHGFWSRAESSQNKDCFDTESSALENLALNSAVYAYLEYPMSREMSCGNKKLGLINPEQQFWISYAQQFCLAEVDIFKSYRKNVLLIQDADNFVGNSVKNMKDYLNQFECDVENEKECSFL